VLVLLAKAKQKKESKKRLTWNKMMCVDDADDALLHADLAVKEPKHRGPDAMSRCRSS